MTDREYELFKNFVNELLYETLTQSQYDTILLSLGAKKRGLRYSTICHNENHEHYNLSFNKETKTFFCFSECNCSYNLISLIKKRFELIGKKKSFVQCVKWLCSELDIEFNFKDDKPIVNKENVYDWKSKYDKYLKKDSVTTMEIYDSSILNSLSKIYYRGWIEEGITEETHKKYGIKFYKAKQQIVIPIFDDIGNFIGTHCRNLNPELISDGMKYYHLKLLNGNEYKFKMGRALFGLNMNKYAIEQTKTAIIFESPKSVMQYDSWYDTNNSVGIFGMNLQQTKIKLLLKYGCNKFIIALDRQYQLVYEDDGVYTKEFERYQKYVIGMIESLKPYADEISIVCDMSDRLDYKDSPVDKGKEVWEELFNERMII